MKSISVQDLQSLLRDDQDVFLLDVREPDEREICKLPNSVFIPMNEVLSQIDKIPQDRLAVFYCHHGIRSYMIIDALEHRFGFTNLCNLNGGIHTWAEQIDRSMARY